MPSPLAIVARLGGALSLPSGPLALDALLASAVALRDDLPPVSVVGVLPIEIPIQREPAGRFHFASFSESAAEEHELRWLNRRFPLAEAQALGNSKLKRVNLQGGPCKSFRTPIETTHLLDDTIRWWCLGEEVEIRALLGLVTHLGKRRGVGLGRVVEWTVSPCEPWPGFPVVRDGSPLRPLPLDWPGIEEPEAYAGVACLTYPYWQREREEVLAMPEVST